MSGSEPEEVAQALVDNDDVGTEHQTSQEALEHDLALVAKSKGWSLQQARTRYEATEAVGRVAEQLGSRERSQFVGSSIGPNPDDQPILYVKGRAPQFVADLVAGESVPIRVLDSQPFSFDELTARQTKAQEALDDAGYDNFSLAPDIRREGRLVVTLTSPETASVRQAVLNALPEGIRSHADVKFVEAPIGRKHFSIGGLRATVNGSNSCTTGWTIFRSSDFTYGITTAGHCTGINGVRHGGSIHTYNMINSHYGGYGDIQWGGTSSSEPAEFFAYSNTIRDTNSVESIFSITIGESVCMYSRIQDDRFCTPDVFAFPLTCNYSGSPDPGNLVMMDQAVAVPGDSGAGWSWNNTAWGSQVGNCNYSGTFGDVFSVADYFDSALAGVEVHTQP